MNEQLMTIKEVADYLNITESTIYTWAQTGKLPAFRVGRLWRFRRSDLDAWLEANRNTNQSATLEKETGSTQDRRPAQ